jgi:hypothetical protein
MGQVNALGPEAVRKLLGTRQSLGVTTTNTLENNCARRP